jgi:Na+/melibiose symporter-like transporter
MVTSPNAADSIAAITDPSGGFMLDVPRRLRGRVPPFTDLLWSDESE